jgi:hypothetical protein
MDVSKTYQHLGWRLSTARRLDPPHRLLTSHDLDSAFKAARTEQGSGRKTKQVFIEILNTVRVWMVSSSLRHNVTLTCRLEKRSKYDSRQVHLLRASTKKSWQQSQVSYAAPTISLGRTHSAGSMHLIPTLHTIRCAHGTCRSGLNIWCVHVYLPARIRHNLCSCGF